MAIYEKENGIPDNRFFEILDSITDVRVLYNINQYMIDKIGEQQKEKQHETTETE